MNEEEFKIFGFTMPQISMIFGVFLIAWATVFSLESKSITSWIPAFLGAPILVSGLLAFYFPKQKKIWMHIAVLFGLIGFVGGFRFFQGFSNELGPFAKPKAAISQLMLIICGGLYTFSCVKSFIWARRNMS